MLTQSLAEAPDVQSDQDLLEGYDNLAGGIRAALDIRYFSARIRDDVLASSISLSAHAAKGRRWQAAAVARCADRARLPILARR